jgi:hypothetical protein
MKNVIALCSVLCLVAYNVDALAATKKTAKQSVLQTGTNVRAKVEASGLYDEECYNAFYGCMDQFCITENANGGTCTCNDLSIKYEQEYADIQKKMLEAERIATVEVEKVKAGADADIIFSGERKYDADGNIVDPDEVSESENN